MKFGNGDIFKLAFIVVPLFLYFAYRVFRILKNLNLFLDKKTREKVLYPVSITKIIIKYVLLAAAFTLFLVALARPWGKPIKSEMEFHGIDIMITLDASSSMGAIDLSPDRMTVVKKGLSKFVDSLAGDRVGLILFAGVNFVQCPLTIDYDAMNLIMDNVSPGMLFKDGTSLGDAIKASVTRLDLKAEKSRIMILVSDGENTGGMSPIKAANIAKEKGVRIYTIGVGTKEGGKIPEGNDVWGRSYFKIYEGREVITKLDDTELKKIAKITGGKYYRVTDRNAFSAINRDIKKLEDNKIKKKDRITFEEKYTVYLLWGLILFILSNFVGTRGKRRERV
jgi:Ca-activated chloride channel family protein